MVFSETLGGLLRDEEIGMWWIRGEVSEERLRCCWGAVSGGGTETCDRLNAWSMTEGWVLGVGEAVSYQERRGMRETR